MRCPFFPLKYPFWNQKRTPHFETYHISIKQLHPYFSSQSDDFSRMRSEGFPFIVWGSAGWTLVRLQLVGAARRFHIVFASFFASLIRCLIGDAAKRCVFCCAHIAVSLEEVAVLERVSASFVVYGSTGTCLCKLCSIR